MRRTVLAAVWLVGCYSPSPSPGAPCGTLGECPSPLVCSPATFTCERSPVAIDAQVMPLDAPPDGASVLPPANDTPIGAIDVTAGGTFPGTFAGAGNDADEVGCGKLGGRDVFYQVKLDAPEVVYFDTLGSSAHTTIRVFPGSKCVQVGGAKSFSCSTGDCGEPSSQLAVSLPFDKSCIVVDANDDTADDFELHVVRGGRDGVVLSRASSQTYSDTTCMHTPLTGASCADTSGAGEVAHALLVCPGTTAVDADTCVAGVDNIMYLEDATSLHEEVCYDDGTICADNSRAALHGLNLQGPGMYWLVVDGFGSGAMETCGPYTLTVTTH